MRRAAIFLCTVGVIVALAAISRDYCASFVLDRGPELTPESLPCAAPDVGVVARLITVPSIWSRYTAPRLSRDVDAEKIRQGCEVSAGGTDSVGGRYTCEFTVSLATGGRKEFDAIVAGVAQYYIDRGAPPGVGVVQIRPRG